MAEEDLKEMIRLVEDELADVRKMLKSVYPDTVEESRMLYAKELFEHKIDTLRKIRGDYDGDE